MGEKKYIKAFNLNKKVVFLTGGAGFLGREFARGYANYGARVAILDIEASSARVVAEQISDESGQKALSVECDIADPNSVVNALKKTIEEFGNISVLHNNAANQSNGLESEFESFEEYKLSDWKRVVGVDLQGAFVTTQIVGKHMVESKVKGSILQTSSIYSSYAPDNRIYENAKKGEVSICSPAVYSAVKAGSEGLVRWLATYWAIHGIRVNAIVPGGIESDQNDEFKSRYSDRIPLGRMARAEEVVGAAIFLASDASSYITGQSLMVDGGLSAW